MGSISIVSVLAGALSALAVFEVLVAIAAAIAVAANGSTNFSAMSDARFKLVAAVILAGATFLAFVFGGYVSGRMSRRNGASHGLMAGILGVILAAVAVAAARGTGADNGLARAATHMQVANSWTQWRTFGLIGMVLGAAAMVLGGLTGGIAGERWHGKLLARAVDPSYGPEAEQRAEARQRLTEAEAARLAAANRAGRITAANQVARDGRPADVTKARPTEADVTQADSTQAVPATGSTAAVLNRRTERGAGSADPPPAGAAAVANGEPAGRRPRHLLGRR